MSAIFGAVHFEGGSIDALGLEKMARALSAHGPDRGAVWLGRGCGLGQRLTHLTPEDRFEQQPLVCADGRRVLVCASRIDNRPELLQELGPWPLPAEQLPDSAIILRTFGRWGSNSPSHLVGDFALAVWDAQEQSLILARSPLGVHPLLYFSSGEFFAFSSMPKGLFALPFVPREIDSERLADFLVAVPADPGSTFYRNIHSLDAGHCLTVKRGKQTIRRYWDLPTPREPGSISDADCLDAFQELFDRAVSDRLRCISSVGVMMSGGLDSTSVAASAIATLSRSGRRLSTFTEVPSAAYRGHVGPGRYADETPYVEAMARRYPGLDLDLIRSDGRSILEGLDVFFRASEEPFPNASNRLWFEAILAACQDKHLRAVLTGASGNLTISWSGKGLLPDLLRNGRWSRALHEARGLRRQGASRSTWRAIASQGILPLFPASLSRGVEQLRRGRMTGLWLQEPWLAQSAIHPEFARSQRVAERSDAKDHSLGSSPVTDFRRFRYQSMQKINNGLGGIASGYQALFGVEQRDPTADLRVTEFCLSLPEEQFLRNGTSRYLIRRAMATRLPPEILAQKQRGQQAADWLERLVATRNDLLNELTALESSDLVREALDLVKVRELVERLPAIAADDKNVLREVRSLLDKAFMGGRFLRWFESGE